ncbi:hypothetical protein RHSIM_Rhsim07G0182300 [Rhododendron simsii]|uniref:No apical meristem-associated C-terminal domain-containing protein n=1 Tax=Rhododendron simsii TaxID=118357 RepID=A0A834LJ39_RHOSS|nr:hypothetical protein RHSIM_Rhsim07G0182300 [Rhododendron simsii]
MSVDQSVSYFNTTKTIETTTEPLFTSGEDVAICEAFLSALEDLRDGNLQSQSNLCNAIFEKFVASTKNDQSRSQDSVQTRWEKIMTRCFKFHAYFTRIRHECHKGLTESQMAHQAKFLYVEYERHPFDMDHCWEILHHRIRWEDLAETKRPNTPTKATDSGSQFSGVSQLVDAPSPLQESEKKTCRRCSHPPDDERSGGREAEKEQPRGKAKAVEVETSHIDDFIDQLNKQARKAEARKDQLEEKRLRLAKKMQEIEDKQVAAKQQERDDAIMFMDTSKMDPQAQLYWAMRKDEIISKAFNRLNISG